MLIEVMVSIAVFGIVFTSLGLAMQQAFVATRGSKDLQVATQLVNERLEQLRAIAGDTLMAGASISEVEGAINSGEEDRLTGSDTYQFNGETLITSTSPVSGSPLNPYRSQVTTDGISITLATYATRCYQPAADPGSCNATSSAATDQELIRITVVANWVSPGSSTVRSVSNQSLVFSPSSCLSTSTHPFSAPCQSFMYAGANAAGGTLSVQGYNATTPSQSAPILATTGLESLEVRLPDATSSLQVEQVGRVKAVASGAYVLEDGQLATGGQSAIALATSDPSQTTTTNSQSLSAPEVTRSVARDNGLTISATGAAAVGAAVAAMHASSLSGCESALGVVQATGGPACGSASLTPTGTNSLSLAGELDGVNMATTLASVASPAGDSVAHVGAYTEDNPDSLCDVETPVGCAAGDLRSRSGAVQIGGLPVGLPAPSGWLGAAVLVDANQADATAETGPGVTTQTEPAVTGDSPVLRVWTGSGYNSIPLTTTTAGSTWTIPATSVTGSGVTVELRSPPGPGGEQSTDAGTVTLGDRALVLQGPTDCSLIC
ncbi:MAG: type II secretion system protein, partial [Candidatus Nanopelagicales bacterium]|nr:type II secretion system protein [Candidatus Nanopelagicales bacterium]